MSKYSVVISDLMNQEASKIKSRDFFLTSYSPSKSYYKNELERRIKSQIRKGLRENAKVAKYSETHQKIISKFLDEFKKVEELGKGIAVFIKFSAEEKLGHGAEEKVVEKIKIVSLDREVKKETYIGKVYDLDQLVWVNNSLTDALIVKLDEDVADVYQLFEGEISKIKEINREMETVRRKEYVGVYSPTSYKKGYFGVASNMVEREKEQAQGEFLNRIVNALKKDEDLQMSYEYLVVFYSGSWRNMIDNFKEEIAKKGMKITPIYIAKNYQDEKEMKREATKKIGAFQRSMKKDLLSLAKEDYNVYVKGWRKVIKADRLKKIDTLFIKDKVKKMGYVYNKEFLYTYPVKGSRKVKSIAPWLVRNVANSSGKLVIINDESLMPNTDVSAKLRY